jgi:hypothetical protein
MLEVADKGNFPVHGQRFDGEPEGGTMKKHFSVILFFSLAFLGATSMVSAQFGQTGSINGTVLDSERMPLPGVGVTIKSPAIILPEMNTLTNAQGIYRFPSLPPGTYEIMYVLQGMNTLVRKDIIVTAGKTITINVTLEVKKIEESIVVTGQTPTVDVQSSTRTTSLDKDFLASVPGFRILDTYFNMTPGVVAESNPNGPMSSANGSGVRDNAYRIDGVTMNAPDVGTQRGEVGMDIMEELSIQSGGLPAEYGDTMGTMINVVTKSGGNAFSGSASFYYNSEKLQSQNAKGTPLEGRLSGYKYIYEPGATLGGPLLKDRLWFFVNLSLNKRAINIAGFPYDKPQTVPAIETRYYPYLKLTLQPNQKNRFSLSYAYGNLIQDNAGAGPYWGESTTVKWDSPQNIYNAQWTHFFNNNLFGDLKVGYLSARDNLRPKLQDTPLYIDALTSRFSGAYPVTDLYTSSRLQVNADLTHFMDNFAGSHEFKLGAEFQMMDATRDFMPERDPRNGFSQIVTLGGFPLYGIWLADTPEHEAAMNLFAFVQDTWKPARRLTLNLGLRVSHQRDIIPAQNEAEGPQTFLGVSFNRSVASSYTPIKRTSIVPRAGAIYDLTGDGKTLFKASFSRYIQSNIIQYFTRLNPNSIWDYVQLLFPDFTPIPGAIIAADFPNPAKPGYGEVGLKSPYTDEFTVGLEREFFTDWSLALRYIRKMDRNLLEDANASQLDIDKLVNDGELVWTNWTQVNFVDPYDGQQKSFWSQDQILAKDEYMINPPGAKRDFDGIEVVLNKRYSRGWSLMASYVYQNSRGLIGTDWFDNWTGSAYYDDPNAHTNAVGKLPLCRPHQFKLQGMVKGPGGVNLSAYFRAFSGQSYTRQVTSSDLSVPLNQGLATIYAEKRGDRGLPAQTILDFRVEKTFRLQRYTFGLFVDCFNLFNGNKATQVEVISSSPEIVFGQMVSIEDPRIFRLGARFEF